MYTKSLQAKGMMTSEGVLRPQSWKKLYEVAMLESDWTELSPQLDEAIKEVLDQIEETLTHDELEELNNALNCLRSRRKTVTSWKSGPARGPSQAKAA
jgi:hypothetical protein